VGLTSKMMMASSIQPIGLRGRRAASSIPTAVAGTTPTVVKNVSAAHPPVPGWWVRWSSRTEATPSPSATTPSRTAAAVAARARQIVLTGIPAFPAIASDEPTLGAPRSEIVTGLVPAKTRLGLCR
jgi:hypothetical protein